MKTLFALAAVFLAVSAHEYTPYGPRTDVFNPMDNEVVDVVGLEDVKPLDYEYKKYGYKYTPYMTNEYDNVPSWNPFLKNIKKSYGYGFSDPSKRYGYGFKTPEYLNELRNLESVYGYGYKKPSYGYGSKFSSPEFTSFPGYGYGYGVKPNEYGNKMPGYGYGYGNKYPTEKSSYGYGNKMFNFFEPTMTNYPYGTEENTMVKSSFGTKYPEYTYNMKFNPFYDPKTTYDFDTFTKFWKVNPIISKIYKYFTTPNTFDESSVYYNVPLETVESFKTSENILETLRTLLKHYYNLPEDVKYTVNEKYHLEPIVKFLLRVYYNIPNEKYTLTPYYDIPSDVLSGWKSTYDLKKIIEYAIEKYSTLPTEERIFFTKYFDVVPVIRTWILSFYGVPKEVVRQLETTFYNTPEYYKYVKSFFADKEDLHKTIESIVEKRNMLTEKEKFNFDKFLNIKNLVGLLVKVYYDVPYTTELPWFNPEGRRYPTDLMTLLNKVFDTYNHEMTPKFVYDKYFNVPDYVKHVLKRYYGFPEETETNYFDFVKTGIERYYDLPTEYRNKYDMYYNVPRIVKEILGKYYGDVTPYTHENIYKFINNYKTVPEVYRPVFDKFYNVPEYLNTAIKRFYGVPETTFGKYYHPYAIKQILNKYYGLGEEVRSSFDKYFNVNGIFNPKFGSQFYTKSFDY